ncbi:hypothetical protein Slin_7004 (plasmid) [Spirosoma linguale DSM 74]|uniref:Uncharacterized protein n=1 Tax=Spirosoma linguale (strain ATCC 33905 / DSM 74 / LMG 10896 / Claus 1) TaxID=504472 RepID=D2QVW5_SPILD|nr:hypothetical protein Slin_7004 [Spirosoma linguale DSM 74]
MLLSLFFGNKLSKQINVRFLLAQFELFYHKNWLGGTFRTNVGHSPKHGTT